MDNNDKYFGSKKSCWTSAVMFLVVILLNIYELVTQDHSAELTIMVFIKYFADIVVIFIFSPLLYISIKEYFEYAKDT